MDPPRFFNARDGACAVYLSSAVVTFVTHDGGVTWPDAQAWPSGSIAWAARGIAHMWAAVGGSLRRSADGGRSSSPVGPLPASQSFAALQFVNNRDGVALALPRSPGALLPVYRTTDGGRTWTQLPIAGT